MEVLFPHHLPNLAMGRDWGVSPDSHILGPPGQIFSFGMDLFSGSHTQEVKVRVKVKVKVIHFHSHSHSLKVNRRDCSSSSHGWGEKKERKIHMQHIHLLVSQHVGVA